MKKIYAITTMMLIACLSFGQVYLAEDFSGGAMPDGWTVENQETQWTVEATANAGGVSPELQLKWVNATDLTRFISPVIDLTGTSDVVLEFKHFLDNYGGGDYVIGAATRVGGGEWTSIWEVAPTADVGPETKIFFLDNDEADFQFCIYLEGNMYNFDFWYIDNIKVSTPASLDLALMSINVPQYVGMGAELDLTGVVANDGLSNITSFDVSYSIEGGDAVVEAISGLDIPMGATYAFTHSTSIVLNEDGLYQIDVTVDNVNGGTDENMDNNSLTAYTGVVPFIPAKKVLGEEATGTWCGWCVRGAVWMDYMSETYPDTWIGVAVHNGDPMVNTVYDGAIGNYIAGYPNALVDRAVGNINPADLEIYYLERLDAISPATIELQNLEFNVETREVTFDAVSEFVVDVASELRFNAIITEDSLWGTESGWNQANYYSGGGNGPMGGYEDMPDPVLAEDMHYDHVGREIIGGWAGVEGSLPASITAGDIITYSFSYVIPEDWIFEKLDFIVTLNDQTSGEILNADDDVISDFVGVTDFTFKNDFKVYPNPTADVANVSFLMTSSETVTMNVYNMLGKVVYSEAANTFAAGQHNIKMSTSDLSEGMYFVELTIGNQKYSQKVSVIK